MEPPANCPACGSVPHLLPRRVQGRELLCCPGCGLQWWDFSGVEPALLYTEAYFKGGTPEGYDDYYALRPALERTGRIRLERIRRHLGLGGGRLLDLGCGPGFFLAVAREAGWQVEGIEVSEAACRYARDALGLAVRCAPIDRDLVLPTNFDLVTLWDVLEHLPDPATALRVAVDALRPGGGLVLTTGDVGSMLARLSGRRWHLYNFPEHFYFHTSRSVRRLLENAGFGVRALRREAMVVSAAYALERVSKTLLGGRGRTGVRALARVWLPLNLGDVITVYAESLGPTAESVRRCAAVVDRPIDHQGRF